MTKLQSDLAHKKKIVPSELASTVILAEQSQKRNHRKELRDVVRVFNKFVENDLSCMLVTEELGDLNTRDMAGFGDEILGIG